MLTTAPSLHNALAAFGVSFIALYLGEECDALTPVVRLGRWQCVFSTADADFSFDVCSAAEESESTQETAHLTITGPDAAKALQMVRADDAAFSQFVEFIGVERADALFCR